MKKTTTTVRALLARWDATHEVPPGWTAPVTEPLPPPLRALVADRDALIAALAARPDAAARQRLREELREVVEAIEARYR